MDGQVVINFPNYMGIDNSVKEQYRSLNDFSTRYTPHAAGGHSFRRWDPFAGDDKPALLQLIQKFTRVCQPLAPFARDVLGP